MRLFVTKIKNVEKVFVVSLLLFSCQKPGRSIHEPNVVSTINISPNVEKSLSLLGIDCDIIKLDDKSDCISSVSKLVITKNAIYLLDKKYGKSIYAFNRYGKYILSYGKIGIGPEEIYNVPTDFYVTNKYLYLFEKESNKLIIYNLKGEIVSLVKNKKIWPYSFGLINDSCYGYAFRVKNFNYDNDYELKIIDEKKHLKNNYFKMENSMNFTPGKHFVKYYGGIGFHPNFSNKIYLIKNDSINNVIDIDFEKYNLKASVIQKIKVVGDPSVLKKEGPFCFVMDFFSNQKWTKVVYSQNNVQKIYLRNNINNDVYNSTNVIKGLFSASNRLFIYKNNLVLVILNEDIQRIKYLKEKYLDLYNKLLNDTNRKVINAIDWSKKDYFPIIVFFKI